MLAIHTYKGANRAGEFIKKFHAVLPRILSEAENAASDGSSVEIPTWTGAEVQGERFGSLVALPGFAVYWRDQPDQDNYLTGTRSRGILSLELFWDKKRDDIPRSQLDLLNLAQSVIQGLRVPQRRQALGLRLLRPTTSIASERDLSTSSGNIVPVLTTRLDLEVEIQ